MDKTNPMVIEMLDEKNRQPQVTYKQIAEKLGCSQMNVIKTYFGNPTDDRVKAVFDAIAKVRGE